MATVPHRTISPPRGLDSMCRYPNPMRTMEDWRRLHHLDLPELDRLDLVIEFQQATRRLGHRRRDPQSWWFIERLNAIQRELDRRRSQRQ